MIDFVDAVTPELDDAPVTADVTDPCRTCQRQIDTPYGGRGRRPTQCLSCRGTTSSPRKNSGPRITGNAQNLAAQATGVLTQLNTMIGIAASAFGLFETGKAILNANEDFEARAYQALLTDPEFCKTILKSGAKSSKLSLVLAYGGMGMTVGPTAVLELKARKAAMDARKLEEQNAHGA